MRPKALQSQFGQKRFWSRLAAEPDFFAQLELMPDAQELYAALKARQPVILTGLPRGAWAEPQKRRWVE